MSDDTAGTAPAPEKRERPKPPVGKGGEQITPKLRLEQRIEQIKALVAAGETTPNIVRRVAAMGKKESADRAQQLAKQTALSEAGDVAGAQKVEVPSIVWSEGPPAERTVERYIKVAKERLEAEAAETVKRGDLVLGIQFSRLNFLYLQAVSDKKWMVALAVVQEANRLHGLYGAIKLELSGPQGKPIQREDVTPLPTTEAAALAMLRDIIRRGALSQGMQEIEVPLPQLSSGNGSNGQHDDFDDEALD